MTDRKIIPLATFHRSNGELRFDESENMGVRPIEAHPFLDAQAVAEAWQNIPPAIELGREIYVGSLSGYEDSPWQLIIGMHGALAREQGRLIELDYTPTIILLDRAGYGDFFAGNLMMDAAADEGIVTRLSASDIVNAWKLCEGEQLTQPCHLVRYEKPSLRAFQQLGQDLVGGAMKIDQRGDVPVVITGMSIEASPDVDAGNAPNWRLEHLANYLQPQTPGSFYAPFIALRPVSLQQGDDRVAGMVVA